MTTELEPNRHLYETDYLKWIETTVKKLQVHDYPNIEWENLIEEIEDMGRSERRSLKSNLIVVLTHLLKWQYQLEFRSGSWSSIVEYRRRIREALKDSPPGLSLILKKCLLNVTQMQLNRRVLKLDCQ